MAKNLPPAKSQKPTKVYGFLVDYAADKDNMGKVSGTSHVTVSSHSYTDARLTAEQMIAARGVEPVGLSLLDDEKS